MVRKVETRAISIDKSNLSKIKNNPEKNENNDFQIDKSKNQISVLSEEVTVMKLDIEDMKKRSLRKTLIFKNILLPKKTETWDKSQDSLTKEIKSVMPAVEESVIREKN